MSKSTLLDKIKNPDVPGLEKVLPPPPPPPPPPIISTNSSVNASNSESINNITYSNVPAKSYFPLSPPLQNTAALNQPWWIPSETDSEVYTQWYECAYKAALQAAQEKDSTGKTKIKYFKRKAEMIDPKTDAERVANAQKELSTLMKPLKCDLCNAVMNSTLQAKLHYQGKPHQKKVSMFLNQSAKKVKTEDGLVSSTTSNDWNLYCDVCKIWFTSQTDATQHYAGKKHLKVAFGVTRSKSKKPQSNKNSVDPTGRYGIGLGFSTELEVSPQLPIENSPIIVPPVPQYSQPPVPYPTPLRCDLCGISANRQDQLDTHKRGTKHLKMLKLHGLPLLSTETIAVVTGPIDYSIYRTPSGQYYCAPCNLSLNSEISFGQHMESKKHKNQVNPKQQQSMPQPATSKKTKKK